MKAIVGYKPLHTHHCVTGSMRHIYEFHGYPISEERLLGLGAGMGFIYWHMKGTTPFLGGRANVGRPGEEGMEQTAGRRTGVKLHRFQTSSPAKAEQRLLRMLDMGEPVMIQVDMAYLPYLDLPEEYHFGAHWIVVAGCDAKTRQALVADRDGELHTIGLDDLARARGSTFKPFPPKNTWYGFDFSERCQPTAEDVWGGIGQVVRTMLQPPIANLGVQGIHTAAWRVQKWPQLMDEGQLRYTCFNVFIFIDATGGTGGGLFRYMYGRFLEEAAQITGDARLVEVAEAMKHIGDRWQEVAMRFKEAYTAPNPEACLPEAAAALTDIADWEQVTWERLQSLAKKA